MSMMNPNRTTQQMRGSVGAIAFELFVNRELKWVYRPVHQENDFGIDGYIDIVDSGKLTGAGLAVQIKCGESYMSKRIEGGLRYDGEIKHLNYYYNLRQPILLIVLDEKGESGYWVEFEIAKTIPSSSKNRWWIEIPEKNKLSPSVVAPWSKIAGPVVDISPAVNAEWQQHQFNDLVTNLIVEIRKDGVLACDVEPLFSWQSQLLKTREMMLKKRGSVEFYFGGWREDKRELFEIPEIRDFYRETQKAKFPWIYWLEPDQSWQGYRLLFGCGCDTDVVRVAGGTRVTASSAAALRTWIDANFDALNEFTDRNEISIEVNKECSYNLMRFIRMLSEPVKPL